MQPTRNPFTAALRDITGVNAAAGNPRRKSAMGRRVAVPRHGHLLALAITLLGSTGGRGETTHTWNGAGTDSNWMTAANWGGSAPITGDLVIFAGTNRLASNNNLAAGSVIKGITFNSGAGAFVITGNSIALGGSIVNNNTANVETLKLNLVIGEDIVNLNAVTGATTQLDGVISGGATDKTLTINSTSGNTGTVILAGANTYVTKTKVSYGKLLVNGSLGATAVTVAGGASLGGTGTIGTTTAGSVTLAAGSTTATRGSIDLVNGSIGTLTLAARSATATVLTLGGTTGNTSVLNFEVGATADKIVLGTNARASIGAGGYLVNLTSIGGLTGATQKLIDAPSGLASGSFGTVTLNSTSGNFGGFTLALTSTATALSLTQSANTAPTTAYWKGTNDGVWNSFSGGNTNISNFATNLGGTNATGKVGSTTDVIFNATSHANSGSTTLGENLTIKSLTFNSNATTAVGIGGSNTLTITPGSSTTGITVATGSGNHTLSTKVALGASQTWTVTDSGQTLTSSNEISGGYALTKAGAGTLTLSGTNTYTGATTINGGVLSIASNANLGAVATGATLNLNGGGKLQATASLALDNSGANQRNIVVGSGGGSLETVTSGHILTVSGIISGTGNLTASGAGTLLLTGSNTLNGAVTINAGSTLRQGNGGAGGSLSGTSGIINNGALIFNRSGTHIYSSIMSGSGSFTKDGSSTLTLTGTNTYTGATIISAGTLQLGDGFTDGSIAGSSGITNNSALIYNLAASETCSHVISGTGTLTKTGAGTLTLSGTNTYTGVTTISGGTLNIAADSGLGTAPVTVTAGRLVLSGGTLAATDSFTVDSKRGITTGGSLNVATGKTLTYGGIAAGTGTLTKTGAGTLVLTGSNSYTGATTISTGTLQIGDGTTNGSLAANAAVTANGALIYNVASATSQTAALSLSGSGTVTKSGAGTLVFIGQSSFSGAVTIEAGTLQIGGVVINDVTYNGSLGNATSITNNGTLVNKNNVANSTFSRVLAGTGDFIMDGGSLNTLTMSGANTYSGATTVTSGTLKLGNAAALGTTATGTTVASGAALDLLGQTVGDEALTLSGTGISAGGALINSDGTAASLSGNISLAANSSVGGSGEITLSGEISGSSMNLTKVGIGILTLSGTNTYTGTTTLSGGTLNITGSLASGSSVAVASGTTLTGTGTVGGTVTVATGTSIIIAGNGISGTLNVNGGLIFDGTGTIHIGTLTNYTSSAALAVAGNLTLSGGVGAVTLALPNGAVSTGTYHLVGHSNSLADLSGLTVTGPDIGNRQSAALANNTGMIDYVVSGAVPYWSGIQSTEWSTNTITGDKNWKLDTNNSPTDFLASDTVLFNDNATNTTADITVDDVTPVSVSVSGSKNFTFTGSKAIAGTGSLTIDSTGSLTISTANTFSGGSSLNAGTLKLGTATALGSGSVTLNGGTLSSDSSTARSLSNNLAIGGNVTLGNATNNGALTFSGTVDLDGVTKVLTVDSAVTLSGVISGTNGGLWKTGTGTITLSNTNTYTGDTTLAAGTLAINSSSSLGASGSMLVFSGSSTLQINTGFTAARDYLINSGVTGTIDTQAYTFTNSGIISGAGALTKTGAGTRIMTGLNSYTGMTTVSQGTMQAGDGTTDGYFGSGGITNNATLIYNNNAALLSYPLDISGYGTFEKKGSGNLTFTGTKTYSGATIISSGTLQLGDGTEDGSIASSTSITNNSTVLYNLIGSSSYANVISGSGTLTKTGAGTLTLSGSNTYTGQTTISGGTLGVSSNANLGAVATGATINLNGGTLQASTNDITLDNSGENKRGIVLGSGGGTFDTATSNKTLTVTGAISGSGALTKTGAGNLTLTGLNTYTGATIVNGGTLNIAADRCLGTAPETITAGQLVLNGSTLAATDSFELNSNRGVQLAATSTLDVASGKTLTYSGGVAGQGGLIKSGTGTLELLGRNQFAGDITHNDGTIVINSSMSLGSYVEGESGGQLIFAGDATLQLAADVNSARSFVFNTGKTAAIDTDGHSFAQGGVFSGSGALTKVGVGSLTLTGTNTYSGVTTINDGTLQIGDGGTAGELSASSAITDNATLMFKRSDTLAQGSNFGTISGTGALIQAGNGTTILTAGNSYTGPTTVSAGTLVVNGDQHLATGAVTVSGTLAGTGTVGGATTISSGGTHAPGEVGTVGTQNFSSDLNYADGSIFEWDLNANSTSNLGYDMVGAAGKISVDTNNITFKIVFGDSVNMSDEFWSTPYVTHQWAMASIFGKAFYSGAFQSVQTSYPVNRVGSFKINGEYLTYTAVPEPTSALVGLLPGTGLLRRRRG
jgi:fibronectin-binding autotransporter adhesin